MCFHRVSVVQHNGLPLSLTASHFLKSFFQGGSLPCHSLAARLSSCQSCLCMCLRKTGLWWWPTHCAVQQTTQHFFLFPFSPPLSASGFGCRYPQQNCVQSQWPGCHKTFLCWPGVGERTLAKDRAAGFKSDLFFCTRIQRIVSLTKNPVDDHVSRLLIHITVENIWIRHLSGDTVPDVKSRKYCVCVVGLQARLMEHSGRWTHNSRATLTVLPDKLLFRTVKSLWSRQICYPQQKIYNNFGTLISHSVVSPHFT